MTLFHLLISCLLLDVVVGVPQAVPNQFPLGLGAQCSLNYEDAFGFGRINPSHNWRCRDSQYNTPYPKPAIDELLNLDQYLDFKDTIAITESCHDFVTDHAMAMMGENVYYQWEGMCKMLRNPVRMVWAKPDSVQVPAGLMGINNGYLPCHVLEGQHLYDVECVHPWSNNPQVSDRRLQRRLNSMTWTDQKKKYCLMGYNYSTKYVCKPSGYMTRHVLVYSPDMHIIFKAKIDDIPTSCVCATCECNSSFMHMPPVQ